MRIVLFFLLLLSSFSCKPDRRSKEVLPQTEAAIEAGDFVLDSVAGGPHSLKEFKGRVVLLNFFTTWCPYCSQEIPHLKDLIEKFGKDGR
ncbi:MAG TPA: TlpA disulfide reductase family protein, partial [bacterium]|nr:TlpA disulfide reductase family protein [bacterium]